MVGNVESCELVHRDDVSDEDMFAYRKLMAPIWFPDDIDAQVKYASIPGTSPTGSVIQSLCLVEEERKIIGTVGIYDFGNIRNMQRLTSSDNLRNLPDWLTRVAYMGDMSVSPQRQKRGLASDLVQTSLNAIAEQGNRGRVTTIGITENSNTGMRGVVRKTGGRFLEGYECRFLKFAENERLPASSVVSSGRVEKLHLDTDYPPVIHLFYDESQELQVATIASSPNVQGVSVASLTHVSEELFPNQCIGIINPELPKTELEGMLPLIYGSISRYKYVNLCQMKAQESSLALPGQIVDGYDQGWGVYSYGDIRR